MSLTDTTTRSPRTVAPSAGDRVVSRIAFWVVVGVVLVYAPLAINYTWHLFSPAAPFGQSGLDSAINGSAYENGPASVNAVRTVDYGHHRVVMLVHTTLGGLALLLALFQFVPAIRAKHPAVHRWTGRVYLPLMTVSMVMAIIFLSLADIIHIDGGRAFDLQLWGLALGTLASAWIGFIAIRAKDVTTHRAWMGMNMSLMLTAPLLRVGWMGLGRVWDSTLLDNLGYSSIALGVVAPVAGVLAFVLTTPSRRRDRTTPEPTPLAVYAALGVIAVAGEVVVLWAADRWIPTVVAKGAWFHVVPLLAYAAICAIAALRHRAAGTHLREQSWRWLLTGAALSPWAALVTALAMVPAIGVMEALIVGLMLGAVGPIVATFGLIVLQAGKWPAVPVLTKVLERV